jgi:hypothetical protein
MATRAERAAMRARRGKKSPWKFAPKSVKNSHTSPRKIATEQEKARALEMRVAGKPIDDIAQALNRASSTVSDWISEAIDRMVVEPTLQFAKLELARLDSIIAKIYTVALAGDDTAQRRLLDFWRHKHLLLGLLPRDGRSPVTNVLINNAGTNDDIALKLEFVMPNRQRLSIDDLDNAETVEAEPITDHDFFQRVRQARPLPAPTIDQAGKHDSVYPLDEQTVRAPQRSKKAPRPETPEYKGPQRVMGFTELDIRKQRVGGGNQGRILDQGPGNGGVGWLK